MLYTLQDARTLVAPFVDSGSCSLPVVDARIDEAIRRLLVKAEWSHTVREMQVHVRKRCFPMPREVEKVLRVDIDGSPANAYNQYYQYMSNGPGDLDFRSGFGVCRDLVDLGDFPFMYDIPSALTSEGRVTLCYKIMAFSTEPEDRGRLCYIRGRDYLNQPVDGGTSVFLPGESIPINQWTGGQEGTITAHWAELGQSASTYRELTAFSKVPTKGHVTLYAVDTATNSMYFLAKYHPDDTTPLFRRYRITNASCGDCGTYIRALVKLRHIPATRADDTLLIQQLDALKLMTIAITKENQGALDQALAYESQAVRLLTEQKQGKEFSGGVPAILDLDPRMAGRPQTAGRMIL